MCIRDSTKDISGATCAQVFYGLVSHYINVYGMKSESEGPDALDDFAREEGIPPIIRSDNARMQKYRKIWVQRLREWLTRAEFTEPHQSQQNPAELRAVKWLKQGVKILLKRTGAPRHVWFMPLSIWQTSTTSRRMRPSLTRHQLTYARVSRLTYLHG